MSGNIARRLAERDWLCLGIGSLALYSLLPTRQYGGDGLRWVSAITGPWPPVLGGNSHLLFPPAAWLWYHLAISVPGVTGLEIIEVFNALAGAAGIALFALILTRVGAGRMEIWLGSVCLAFANAYSRNATDLVEVMPSVPFVFLAILLLLPLATGTTRGDCIRCVLAGSTLAFGTALYQASAFSLGALGVALWWSSATMGRRLKNMILMLSTYVGVVAFVYMGSYLTWGGATDWVDAFQKGLATDSTPGFGQLDPRHLAGSLFGWVSAWIGLFDFQGISYLTHAGITKELLANLLLIGLQYGLAALIVLAVWRQRVSHLPSERRALMISAAWFLPPFLFTAYWLPAYGKLWITPLAATIAALALWLTASQRIHSFASSLAKISALALGTLTVGINLGFGLLPLHFLPNVYRQEVEELASGLGKQDLVITDGWGAAAVYYQSFASKPYVAYAELAVASRGDNAMVSHTLAHCIAAAQSWGGQVFFLGLLDLDASDWNPLFGGRFRMDYGQLGVYRLVATPVATLSEETLSGRPLHLWILPQMPKDYAVAGSDNALCPIK